MRNILTFGSYLLITFFAFTLSNLIVFEQFWMDGRAYPSLLLASLLAVLLSYFVTMQNSINVTTQIPQLLLKLFEFMFVFSFLVLVYWFSVSSVHYSKDHIILFLVITVVLLFIYNYLQIRYLRRNLIGIPKTNTIVIGENEFARQFIQSIKTNDWMGFVFKHQFIPKQFSVLDSKAYLIEHNIESVFINWDEFHLNKERELEFRNLTETKGIKFYAISEIYGTHLLPSSYKLAGNFPYVQLFTFPLDKPINATAKRIFDIFFALLFFVFVGSWLFPIIILILLVNQGTPIFFSQERNGIDKIVFNCYKFRTMVENKESDQKTTVKNDPRVTKIGRVLRRTSLDELPQFWNVLTGDMSVVGPRPHMLNQNQHYNSLISKYNFRHYVKPGITGLAQVEGFRGEIKEDKDMEDRVQLDLYYIRNWSFALDLMIIYRTAANMIKGDKNAI